MTTLRSRFRTHLLHGIAAAAVIAFGPPLLSQGLPDHGGHREHLPNLDRRAPPRASAAATEAAARAEAALGALATAVRGVRVDRDPITNAPAFIRSTRGFLTAPRTATGSPAAAAAEPYAAVKEFVDRYPALFGHDSAVLTRAQIRREFVTVHNGLRSVVWEQRLDGITVFEATFQAHLTARDELVNVASRLVPSLEAAAGRTEAARAALIATPPISVRDAVARAAQNLGVVLAAGQVTESDAPQGAERKQRFTAAPLSDTEARLVWLPMDAASLRLCWEVICTSLARGEMFRVLIDAETGEALLRHGLTEYISNASYRVFTSDSPTPFSPGHATPSTAQPATVSRSLVTLSALSATASPNGWINDGVIETRGNNVDAHTDVDGNNVADVPRPQATGAGRVFDPPLDLSQEPSTYRDAAVVNLFYWCNWMHDQLYELGFTESAGNFQIDNFGRGGIGNDPLQADAQDGSGTNNASMSTPPDGTSGRLQMFLWNGPTPDRDGDFDMEVVLHEYTHGLSNRLVGGGAGISALATRGMGEGWSDFYPIAMLAEATDDLAGNWARGGYSRYAAAGGTFFENYYFGGRRYPYSTNMAKNPLTLKDIDPTQASPHTGIPRSPIVGTQADQVHNMGEVWCVTLWDARAALVRKHGFTTGNRLVLQLVTDGMKLSPANPNFLQARDAILQADRVLSGGANLTELWTAFAKRGMGAAATAPVSTTTVGVVESFDLPDDLDVAPFGPSTVTGVIGGPFAATSFTLTNTGTAALNWSAAKDAAWLNLSSTGGTLAAGATTTVTATPNSSANSLSVGVHAATLTFTNISKTIAHTRTLRLDVEPVTQVILAEDFESGTLDGARWTVTGTSTFRTRIDTANGPHGGTRHLTMDSTTSNSYARNEATLTVNLAGEKGVRLRFWAKLFDDEPNAPPSSSFNTGADFDGVAISADGVTWHEVQGLRSTATPPLLGTWSQFTIDLDSVLVALGLSYNSAFKIRFNQFDNFPIGFGDGIAIDDIQVLRMVGAGAPTISTQPTTQTANVGDTVSFSVVAAAVPAPSFQWNLNGSPIAGATNSTLTMTNVQVVNAGTYTVAITNLYGTITSTPVELRGTLAPPTITAQPQHVVATAGQAATLSVTASGSGTLGYQWRRNGFPIAGATSSSYTLAAASRSDADFYDVFVNAGLSITASQRARLSVAPTSYPGAVAFDRSLAYVIEDANVGVVNDVRLLADGGFLIAGEFATINGQVRSQIARFNRDGTLDPSFVPVVADQSILAAAPQADGKILICGNFYTLDGESRGQVARLNADGSLDRTFSLSRSFTVYSVAALASGKSLVWGGFSTLEGQTQNRIARLNANGTIDSSFSAPAINGSIYHAALQADGKVVIGGWFTTVGGMTRNRVARLNADGSLDAGFNPDANGDVQALAVQSDGKILLGGWFSMVGGVAHNRMARVNTDGSVDATFNPAFNGAVNACAVQADGKIVVGGYFTTAGTATRNFVARLNADGTLDTAFAPNCNSSVNAVVVAADGSILLGGRFTSVGSVARGRFAKLNADGSVHTAVAPAVRGRGAIQALAHAPNAKVYVGGTFTHINNQAVSSHLIRLNADGTIDASFNPAPSATVQTMAVQGDGKLLVGGSFAFIAGVNRPYVARLNASGTLDLSFTTTVDSEVNSLALQPDRRVLLAGSFSKVNGQTRGLLARVSSEGASDLSFSPIVYSDSLYSPVRVVAAQPDGRIVIGGSFKAAAGQAPTYLARLNADGTLDAAFKPTLNRLVNSIVVQLDGKLVIGGGFTSVNGLFRQSVARLNADGTNDPAFHSNSGANSDVTVLLPQENDRLLTGGYFSSFGGQPSMAIGRLNANGSADTAFQFLSDGAAFRPASALLLSDNGQLWAGGAEIGAFGLARLAAAVPASITTQPVSQTSSAGGSATFSVSATGTPAPRYQWNLNGSPIAGATKATLTIGNVQLANTGTYTVTVSNGLTTTTSNPVTLSGSDPLPTIAAQPQNIAVTAGQSATFSVGASGAGPLSYQWRRNGFPIAGATGSSHMIGAASRSDADAYDVVVSVGLSSVISQSARLSVAPSSYPGLVAFERSAAMLLENESASGFLVSRVLPFADGKFLVVGGFVTVNGEPRAKIARFHGTGTLDTTFVPVAFNGQLFGAAAQSDGKLLVFGFFTAVGGNSRSNLARLNLDGSIDDAFNPAPNASVSAAVVLPDGKILVSGGFSTVGGQSRSGVARLNPDGSADPAFVPSTLSSIGPIVAQPDGKVVVGGYFTAIGGVTRNRLARLNADGSLDAAFDPNANGSVFALAVQADGKILVGGQFSSVGGATRSNLARLNPDGTPDSAFTAAANGSVEALAVQGDGKILVGGFFTNVGGETRLYLARLHAGGTIDTGFNPSANSGVRSIAPLGDGSILVSGYFSRIGAQPRSGVARLTGSGAVDESFAPTLRGAGVVNALAHAAGGKLYVGGSFTHANGQPVGGGLIRLSADGTVDAAFKPAPNSTVSMLAVQGDGKLLVGGQFSAIGGLGRSYLARINTDGTADQSFTAFSNGAVNALAIQPDGRVLLGGSFGTVNGQPRNNLARIGADGGLDIGFQPNPNTTVLSLAIQPNGQIVFGGYFNAVAGQARANLARVNADGSLDTGFNPNPTGPINHIAVRPDGRLLVAGSFSFVGGQLRANLAQLNADGTLDAGFNTDSGFNNTVHALLLQEDSRVLAGGYFSAYAAQANTAQVARLNADATRDSAFQFGASAAGFSPVSALALSDAGQLWIGGAESSGGGLARLVSGIAPVIATHPASQTASIGGTVAFTVTASGVPAPTYQWSLNGVPLSGATAATLTLTNVQLPNAGSYTVTVTNAFGLATSNPAVLAGTDPAPVISAQPQGRTVDTGSAVSLSVGASGSGLTYQWRRNGLAIAGATSATLALGSANRSLADVYDVVVASGLSVTVSQPARVRVAPSSYPQVLDVDPAFNAVVEALGGVAHNLHRLADGRIIAVGSFTRVNGTPVRHIARLSADGTVDPTFAVNVIDQTVNAVVAQSDGKLVIGGSFTSINGNSRLGLARLNADGTLDASYAPGSYFGTRALLVQPDGKLLVATAQFSTFGSLARLNPDGSRDASFAPNVASSVETIALQPDGKILVGGSFTAVGGAASARIIRLDAAGAVDPTFSIGTGFNGPVYVLRVLGNGRILVGGSFASFNGSTVRNLARLTASGAIDSTWTPGNGPSLAVRALEVEPDGRILVGGAFSSYNGVLRTNLCRVSADGVLDSTFSSGLPNAEVISLLRLADGSVLVGGNFTHVGSTVSAGLTRLSTDGTTVSAAFSPGTLTSGTVNRVVPLGDGRIIIGGNFFSVNGSVVRGVARLNANGSVDATFNSGGSGLNTLSVADLFVRGDGKIVIAGSFNSYNGVPRAGVARLHADGMLDATFDPRGRPNTTPLRIYDVGRGQVLVLAASLTFDGVNRLNLARLLIDGSLDSTFVPPQADTIAGVALPQADGGVLIGGSFTTIGGQSRLRIARLLPTGALDPTFNASANSSIETLALAPDGKILVGGFFETLNGVARSRIGRLHADGTIDPTWDPGVSPSSAPSFILVQEDDRILVSGAFGAVNGQPNTALLTRLLANGALDATAAFPYLSTAPSHLAMLDSGALIMAGGYMRAGSAQIYGLLRTTSVPGPIFTSQPPGSIAISAGTSITLSARLAGVNNPTYQWLKDGNPIAGANTSFFTLFQAQPADAGAYSVSISHSGGAVNSTSATVAVSNSAPSFAGTISGFGGAIKTGSQIALIAPALSLGTKPVSYQWSKDGAPVPGATGAAFVPSTWQVADAGTYSVTASNGFGSADSAGFLQQVADTPDWTPRFPLPQNNPLLSINYLNGRFVAGGARGTILTSNDGQSWTVTRLGVSETNPSIAYGNGVYVAIFPSVSVFTSPDATTWTRRTFGLSDGRQFAANPNALTFAAGRFVAVGTSGLVASSPDGVTWTVGPRATNDSLSSVAYGAGKYIATGASGRTLVSSDGQSWSPGPALPETVSHIAFGAGLFVAAGSAYVYTSPDGVAWTRRNLPTGFVRTVQYTGAGFLIPPSDPFQPAFAESSDGLAWTRRVLGFRLTTSASAMTYGAGRYVIVGSSPETLLSSADGTNWTRSGPTGFATFRAAAASTSAVVAVGSAIYRSTDGNNWTAQSSGTNFQLNDVAHAAGRFVAVGDSGTILTSADGVGWTTRTSGTNSTLRGVNHVNDRFLALGDNGTLLSSTDGESWTAGSSGTGHTLYRVSFGNGTYVAVGNNGTVLTSTNGTSWTAQSMGFTHSIQDIVFANGLFVLGSTGLHIRTSPDGTNWTARTNPVNVGFHAVAHVGGKFHLLSTSGTTYLTSSDGATWTPAQNGCSPILNDLVAFGGSIIGVGNSATIIAAPGGGPTLTTPPVAQSTTVGGSVTFTVSATGAGTLAYQWLKDGGLIPGATSASLVLNNVQPSHAGDYSVRVTDGGGSTTSPAVRLTVNPAFPPPGLLLGAARANLGTGNAVAHGTFTVEGSAKQVLVRAVGPALALFGVPGVLSDPQLEIYSASGAVVATNNDWAAAANAAQITAVSAQIGAYPIGNDGKDAAVLATFPVGSYRVRAFGANGGTGNASIEIYDADATPRLVFAAFRARVASGTSAFVGGFTVAAPPAGRSYLIRVLGPSLGVSGALADPQLAVRNASGVVVASNDNWGGDPALADLADSVGAMPLSASAKDAVVHFTPTAAGAFAVVISGVGGGTGLALLEIFEVDAERAAQVAPAIVSPPANVTVAAGQPATFGVVAMAKPAPAFQWRRNGSAIPGATNPTYGIAAAQSGDAGNYDVVVSNSAGSTASIVAALTLITSADFGGTQSVVGAGYVAGATVTIANTLTYKGEAASLGWTATIPAGWSYVASGGSAGNVPPAVGATGLLEWAWTSIPASPVMFTYTLSVPSGETATRSIAASAIVRPTDSAVQTAAIAPPSLPVSATTTHSADTNRDFQISLFELTRVIELYNTRTGTNRTGCYRVQDGSEDGFAAEPGRLAGSTASLARHHSADTRGSSAGTPRDGAIDLFELTRVIELYNYRVGTTRTGHYRAQSGTEDGFAPGP